MRNSPELRTVPPAMLAALPPRRNEAGPPAARQNAYPRALAQRLAASGFSSDVAIRDWNDLFSAVKARLRLIVGATPPAAPATPRQPMGNPVQASVLECVEVLDQLQLTLVHELVRRQQGDAPVGRSELAGTVAAARERCEPLTQAPDLFGLSPVRPPQPALIQLQIEQAMASACADDTAVALLHIDLDGFGRITDSEGPVVADELLRIVAARLSRSLRGHDLAGYLGASGFGCLLGDVPSRALLCQLVGKLWASVVAPCKIGHTTFTLSPSMGIAIYPSDADSAAALIENAATAMRLARTRHSCYAFYDSRDAN